jgi:hypothetical protein
MMMLCREDYLSISVYYSLSEQKVGGLTSVASSLLVFVKMHEHDLEI